MPNLSELTEPSETDRFELDFGKISITSKFVQERNRWVYHPLKLFNSMQVTVHNSDLRFDFKTRDTDKTFVPILKEDNVDVDIKIPNGSPFFEERNDRGAHIKPPLRIDSEGHTFDMDQVDTSVSVEIKQSLLKLQLKQNVIIELFKTLEHNVMMKDKYSAEFTHAL